MIPYLLTVVSQPSITSSDITPTRGDLVTIHCSSTPSRPEPEFIWYHNGAQQVRNVQITSRTTTELNLYEFTSTLTITSVDLSDSGEVTCQIVQRHPDLSQQLNSSIVSVQISVRSKSD